MTHEELKIYIKTLTHLKESKIKKYLEQVDELKKEDIPKVYTYLFKKTADYYADIGGVINKIEKEMDEELYKYKIAKDKKNLDVVRNQIDDL